MVSKKLKNSRSDNTYYLTMTEDCDLHFPTDSVNQQAKAYYQRNLHQEKESSHNSMLPMPKYDAQTSNQFLQPVSLEKWSSPQIHADQPGTSESLKNLQPEFQYTGCWNHANFHYFHELERFLGLDSIPNEGK
jgi:hypothetical protein